MAFKIKTTAVKRYVVRPNLGFLLPGKTLEVAVLLNYDRVRAEGVDLATLHDRFQILAIPVDDNEQAPALLELWQRTPEERISKTMVKCKFVSPNLVKTVTPHRTLEGSETGAMLSSPEPDLEQAKQTFKNEMAVSKAKKEAKLAREERDALAVRLGERDLRIAQLEKQLGQERGVGAVAGDVTRPLQKNQPSILAKWSRRLLYFLLYLVLLILATVAAWKVLQIDVLQRMNPDWSVARLLGEAPGQGGTGAPGKKNTTS